MKPYFQQAGVELYHGDARELASEIATVDLLVTDPPYGVNWKSKLRQSNLFGKLEGDHGKTSIQEFLTPTLKPLRGCRHVYCFGANTFDGLPISGVVSLVWDKGQVGLGNLSSPWGTSHEKILFGMYAPEANAQAKGRGNTAARLRKESVLRFNRLNGGGVWKHPTEKPVALLREFIESSSMIGERVFDPYAGSGSTLEAAVIEGRQAVGIEIDERYCEVIAKRLSQLRMVYEAVNQGT